MPIESTSTSSATRYSPLKDNWSAVVFMLCLLLAAGITATIVGYRVKKADWDRKGQLLATYKALGGSFETLMDPSKTILTPQLSNEQRTFVVAYEINQRAREYGVFTVIDNSSRENLALAVSSLAGIGAFEASRTLDDTIKALDGAPHAADRTANVEAQRYARQYGRPMSRETEAKLFKYLLLNRKMIAAAPAG
jgi:hypothetical protein